MSKNVVRAGECELVDSLMALDGVNKKLDAIKNGKDEDTNKHIEDVTEELNPAMIVNMFMNAINWSALENI